VETSDVMEAWSIIRQRKRRTIGRQYSVEVVGCVHASGTTPVQLAKEVDLTETAVRSWVEQAAIDAKEDSQGPLTSEERAELTRFRREVKTTMERDFLPGSCSLLRQERSMSFELIEAEKGNYPTALLCRALGLSRPGHRAFETRGPSRRDLEDQKLDLLVAAIFEELGGRYGRHGSRRSCAAGTTAAAESAWRPPWLARASRHGPDGGGVAPPTPSIESPSS
jgi:transposase